MKTCTPEPVKAASSKNITPAFADEAEKLSIPRLLSSDAKGRAATVYWTIKQSNGQPPKDWGLLHQDAIPHNQLCNFQFGTIGALVKWLKGRGNERPADLARVEVTGTGFRVDYHPTLADALAAGKESAENSCCPFCQKSDKLEEIRWCCERFDGSEIDTLALRCNRCDAVAPEQAWKKMAAPGNVAGKTATRKGNDQ